MEDSTYDEVKWCYQIIDHGTPERPDYCVHEVYFDIKTKRIVTHTLSPVALENYENKEELIEVLEMIIEDLKKNKVLSMSDVDQDVFRNKRS